MERADCVLRVPTATPRCPASAATAGEPLKFDIEAPGDYLDGVLFASVGASEPGPFTGGVVRPMILRAITSQRASALYTAKLDVAFDATKAQVMVFNACDRNDVGIEPRIDRPHDTTLAARASEDNQAVWMVGSYGRYVLFPNVDVTQPTALLDGSSVIPLEAGTWTMVAVCTVLI